MGSYPPTLIVITGPTASGKSALAVDVAERLHTEIISADSRQIYQGIPIVTAMPTPEERRRVPHHLVDMLPLDAYYSASEFEQDALSLIRRLLADRGVAVVCGGSMMYVDALCNGIDDLPTVPDHIRSGLKEEHEARGDEWLLDTLSRLDPEYFRMVDRCNIKRVFHAVEIIRASGEKYSRLRTGRRVTRDFRILKICLDAPRELLFDRINRRVDLMVETGLEEEARSVYHLRHLNSLNTVGLKEMFAMFSGEMTPDVAIERIKKNTRVYAKKQITWRKRDTDYSHLDIRQSDNAQKIIDML
ncbi:MAG: tRNA (adenosine(37)-N6)-dimethylallyltransferase MiaA [Muribaculaceae bacterium]|nr:tRNA (adenosine(37)-N6)-dimethylallyltransferase MiaA [Muribaculaceae bacterium]